VANLEMSGQPGKASAAAASSDIPSESILRGLFAEMPSGAAIHEVVCDAAGKPIDYRFLDVNPAFESLTGLRAADIIGKLARDVLPGLEPEWIERYGRVALTGEPDQFESFNSDLHRRFHVRAYRPKPGQFAVIFDDVTELRERAAFVEAVITSSGDGVIVYDRDFQVLVWNPVMEGLTGLAAGEVLGRNGRELFPEVMSAGVGDDIEEALAGESPTSREFEFVIPRSGRRGWVVQTNRPHRNAAGEIIGVVASIRDITDRHMAEEALQVSEEMLRTIFDSVGDGVAIHQPGGNFLEVNRVVCERLGYSREELLAMPVSAINTPASAALVPERTARILSGDLQVFETTHVRRDGSEISIEVATRLIDFRGHPAILSVHRDITERKRAEAAMHEQARFMQAFIDAIPIPIIGKDLDGRARVCNAAFAASGGRQVSEIIGKTVAELGIPEPETHLARDRDVLASGQLQAYEAFMPLPGGRVRRHYLSKAPLRAADGTIEGVVTAAVDIGDRYDAEQALRQSEERFRTLFDFASDAIFIHEVGGRFVEVNRTACERLGYSREELLAMSPDDIDSAEFALLASEREQALISQGAAFFETAHVRRDGTLIPVEVSATVIDLGGRRSVLSLARDITERRQAEAERLALEGQLRQAQKMEEIGRLAGGIAHDFNNLLTAIRGSASLALVELPQDSGAREDLEQIEQAADRAASLTRQLLAFARRTVLQPEVVDLGAIVLRLQPMLRRLIGEDVRLETVTPAGVGCVLADPGQIEQVIVNLAVNAGDAMPDGGTLIIAISETGGTDGTGSSGQPGAARPMTSLSVTDTGMGMEQATLDHLFEPFFTTKGPGKGTGLGLATVYGIVRQSGGTVTAQSTPGQGSTFTVYLPRVADTDVACPEPMPAAAARGARTGRILVVEDDSGVRRFASRVLEGAGYEVLTAVDGVSAIEAAAGADVQLVLTDVVMPGMSGREVAAALSASQPGVRVLYMSGHTDKGIVHDGVLEPDVSFLAKPFTAQALLAAVESVMAQGGEG
jgi:two-component system, cell cycle sensor histidine kinase and response regulator CckA